MSKKKIKSNVKFCFPSEFIAARHMAGFSIASVAKMCGRDQRTIRNWESGSQPCPAWALRLIFLESRYMDALYKLQHQRSYESPHVALHYGGMAANDADTGKNFQRIACGNSLETLAYGR